MLRKAVVVLLLTVLAASPVSAQQWARKMFEETSHDFGSVARGAKAEHEFVLKNIYLEDVHIAGVRSSCGCTKPSIKTPWLKTYQRGAVVAKLNTRLFLGAKGATITVTFDKPFPAQVQLHVRGYIRSDVVLHPASAQLGSVDLGSPAEAKVAIEYAGRGSWKILEARSSHPNISGEVVEKSRRAGRVAYELKVQLDEEAPVGNINEHLLLVTNDRRRPQIPVQVEGRVVSAVTVSPASLFMGVVRPGQKVTKQLIVRGKQPFRVLSVTCDDDSFGFGASSGGPAKRLHVIPVTFAAGDGMGKIVNTIRIQTDLGQMIPELAAYAVVSGE